MTQRRVPIAALPGCCRSCGLDGDGRVEDAGRVPGSWFVGGRGRSARATVAAASSAAATGERAAAGGLFGAWVNWYGKSLTGSDFLETTGAPNFPGGCMEVPRIGFLRPPERGDLRDEARGLLAIGPTARPVSRLVVPAWTKCRLDGADGKDAASRGTTMSMP